MLEVLSGFDWLGEQFSTSSQRLVVTVAAVGLLSCVVLAYSKIQCWLSERTRALYADFVTMFLLVGACALTIAVVLGVWQETTRLTRAFNNLELDAPVIARVVISGVIILSGFIITRFVRRVIRELFSSSTAVTDHQREVTHRLSQVTIWSVTLVVILGVWIEDLSGLLVGAGLFGAGLGMAARQTVSSILAGFVLMFSRPFEIGDWIEVQDSEGTVTDISIFNTRVQSFDGEYIMIPNDLIASGMIINRSKRGRLRIEVEIGIDYTADIERAVELAEETMKDLDIAQPAPAPHVVSKGFGDSSVLLSARFWIDKPSARRRWQARTAAVREIKEAFDESGIKIPYPQRELSGRAEHGGLVFANGEQVPPGAGDAADPNDDSSETNSAQFDERADASSDTDHADPDAGSETDGERVATSEES
ncbi:small mechanosensitive ion channel protein MscS [Halostagnicola larsenii XH-48]|uniref:Small mechanosensitive ion channel protein MscS n=1 Tax=Halostagnicola larsenii XH-48 TaxID=797299 RepID=W0JR63_9EURY|nr:mechanosensitive ion channel family protein [Halostagnicola larsenii]AHF99766.1 small mechanosensitive ion channel protein MscS [Halostagnicola larsenii XH-48]